MILILIVVSDFGFIISDFRVQRGGVSRGTEISKYPEENKSNEIPLVSDERTGKSPNPALRGVVGLKYEWLLYRRTGWKAWPKNVTAVYSKFSNYFMSILSTIGDGKLRWESGPTMVQG